MFDNILISVRWNLKGLGLILIYYIKQLEDIMNLLENRIIDNNWARTEASLILLRSSQITTTIKRM